jgi:hypothetical protein
VSAPQKWLVWISHWEDREPVGIFESESDAKAVAEQIENGDYGPVRSYAPGDWSLRQEWLWCVRAYAVGDNAAISIYEPERCAASLVDSAGVIKPGCLKAGTLNSGHNNDGPYAIAYATTAEEAERMATDRIRELAEPIQAAWAARRG